MFAAITVATHHPQAQVTVFEKRAQLLSKVRISGGGRCNLSHACKGVDHLIKAYPRGGNSLKKIFHQFSHTDTRRWFEEHGLPLAVMPDDCVFPASQDAMSVVKLLINEASRLGVRIELNSEISQLYQTESELNLVLKNSETPLHFDKVIVTAGGIPTMKGLQWLAALGHEIVPPAPSLFTFNIPNDGITALMGLVVENVTVSLSGSKLSSQGTLLITHWGLSGPAVLKLSAFAARRLYEQQYHFEVRVNWTGDGSEQGTKHLLEGLQQTEPKKHCANSHVLGIPARLWQHLLHKAGIAPERSWQELGHKSIQKLAGLLTADVYQVRGKSTFREEFVTSGGVSLRSIDVGSLQSKSCPNLYFAGEVLDIDGITGGFNLQAAWSTGFVAGLLK